MRVDELDIPESVVRALNAEGFVEPEITTTTLGNLVNTYFAVGFGKY